MTSIRRRDSHLPPIRCKRYGDGGVFKPFLTLIADFAWYIACVARPDRMEDTALTPQLGAQYTSK